jgi:hypothetical protein
MRSILAALLMTVSASLFAATFHIGCTGTTDDIAELVAAIDFANDEQDFPGTDTIQLSPVCVYVLAQANNFWYGPNALPAVQSSIIFEGNGSTLKRDLSLPSDTAHAFRFFYVSGGFAGELAPGHLTLHDMTLNNGLAKGGDSEKGGGGSGMGGAIFNQGALDLSAVTLSNNFAHGGNSNVGSAGGGGGMGGDAVVGKAGGFGGTLPGGPFGGTSTGIGGAGFVPGSGDTSTSLGGGLGNLGSDQQGDGGTGDNFFLAGLGANFGQGALDGGSSSGGGGGIGGGGGGGGFIGGGGGFGGGGGAALQGAPGGFGGGGGGSAANTQKPGGFGGGHGGTDVGGGGAGMGGAIFNFTGNLALTNCTLANNAAIGGSTDAASAGQTGSGLGAAIFNLNGNVQVYFSTIAINTVARTNAAAGGADGSIYSIAFGSKIQDGTASAASLTFTNSIGYAAQGSNGAGASDVVNNVVAGNSAGNNGNAAMLAFAGANTVRSVVNLGTLDPGSTVPMTAYPQIAGLSANNVPSAPQTMSIAGGPAFNAAVGACPATDERGVPRPQFGACDIGAFEESPGDDGIFFNGFE